LRGPQFSQVLGHAHQETPRQAPLPSRPAATQDTQARAVSRRQRPAGDASAGRERPAADRTDEKPAASEAGAPRLADASRKSNSAESADGDSDRGAGRRDAGDAPAVVPDASATRAEALPVVLTAAQLAGVQPREGEVVAALPTEPTLTEGYAPSARIGGTLQAQVGLAAYRMSPHGAGEPGAAPPSEPVHAGTAMQNADPNQAPLQADLHVVNVFEMVQLSNAARAAAAAGEDGAAQAPAASREDAGRLGHADPNSAQARNQLLSQIGAPAYGAPQPKAPATVTAVQPAAGATGVSGRGAADLKEAKPESPAPEAPASGSASAAASPGAATVGAAAPARDAQPALDGAPQAGPNLMNRIFEQSRWLIRSGHSEATFKLQPEHLGEMRLKVVHKDGDLAVQMTVDSAATKHIVEASLNDLRQRLQTEHLAQGNVFLNVDVQHGSDSGRFAHLAQQAAQDGRARGVNAQPVEQAAPAAASRPAVWGSSNISIYA
jgi:flagellar hook-length control protein FliK